MKRQELVALMDQGEFLTCLADAKISDAAKMDILNDHREWQREQILSGKPYRTAEITVQGKTVAVGEMFTDPYTGRLRMNTGR